MLKVLFLVTFTGFLSCNAEVTDKQYASMPDIFYMENYDKCMMLEDEAFYCLIQYDLEPLNPNNASETWKVIEEVISNRFNYRHDHLRHSICIPWSCPNIPILDENDPKLWSLLEDCYNKKYEHMGLKGNITKVLCDTSSTNRYPIGIYEILVAVVFCSYIAGVIFATFYEGVYRYKTKEEYDQFINTKFGNMMGAFSLTRNWIRLTTVNDSPDIEKLRCIQGIRVYNMALVILSHTSLTFLVMPVANTRVMERLTEKPLNVFLSSGPLCVSTFFLLSGFLLVYGLFSHFENKKIIKPFELFMIFVNRCLRLTPSLIFMLGMHTSWIPHLGKGPWWDDVMGNEFRICRKNWWTNLLYVQNIFDKENMCIMQTWYLAIDTQYFIIALILIYFMKKHEKKIPLILGFFLIVHILVTFYLNYINEYESSLMPLPESFFLVNVLKDPQWHAQIGTFYGNFPGLLIGMGYGYIYYKYKNVNFFKSKISVVFWWVTVLSFNLGIIIFPGLLIYNHNVERNPFWASVYISLCRTIFSTGTGLIIFGISQGIGWIAKFICEWRPTYILGRLTFSAFLIQVLTMRIKPALLRYPLYIDDYLMLTAFLSDFFMAFIAGTVLTLFVELPISELQKQLLPKKEKKTEDNAVTSHKKEKLK